MTVEKPLEPIKFNFQNSNMLKSSDFANKKYTDQLNSTKSKKTNTVNGIANKKLHKIPRKDFEKIIHFSNKKNVFTSLDRTQLQKNLIEYSETEKNDFFKTFFSFLKDFIVKIKLLFGLIDKSRFGEINFNILSNIIRAVPNQGTCPSSAVLSYMHEFLKKENTHKLKEGKQTKKDKKLEESLKHACRWSEEIENLKTKSNLCTHSKELQSFIQKLKSEMKTLSLGDKRMIPGGWQREGLPCADAIYEIENTGKDSFTVRILSLDEENKDYWRGEKNLETETCRYNPLLEYHHVSTQQMEDSLEPLILIQLPQFYPSKKQNESGFLEKRMKVMTRLMEGYHSSSEKQKQTSLSPLKIMGILYQQSPKVSKKKLLVKIQSPNFSKVVLTYMKSITPECYKSTKIKMELDIFFSCINKEGQSFIKNKSCRDLVHASARKLIHEMEKNRTKIDLKEEVYEETLRDLKDVLIVIQKLDQKIMKVGIPSIPFSSFEQKIQLSPPVLPPKNTTSKSLILKRNVLEVPFVNLDFPAPNQLKNKKDADFETISVEFDKQLQGIKRLYKEENYSAMEALILDLAQQLPFPVEDEKKTNYWNAIYEKIQNGEISKGAIKKWSDSIYELNQLFFDSQISQAARPTPEKVIANANLLAIADRLMVLKGKIEGNNCITSNKRVVYFDPIEIKKIIRNDRYFRLTFANQHRMAEEILKYWDDTEATQNRSKLSLESWGHLSNYMKLLTAYGKHHLIPKQDDERLQAYIEHYAIQDLAYLEDQKPNHVKNIKQLFGEVEISSGSNHLPSEFVQQRKMHLMMKGMLSQWRSFILTNEVEIMKVGNQMMNDVGDNVNAVPLQEIWQRLWKIQSAVVQSKFLNQAPEIDQKTGERKHTTWEMNEDGRFIIFPYQLKLCFQSYSDWQRWHKTGLFYRDQGKYLDEQTDRTIVQFQIGEKNEGEHVLTQQTLMNKSGSEEEKIMQSMQAGDSRLEQTFATFAAHPEFLSSSSKQRVFELNMFKQGELFKKIKDHPAFAQELLSFAQDNIELAYGVRNIPRALFFTQLRDNIREYVILSDLPSDEKDKILQKFPSFNDFEKLLKISLNNQEKRTIYNALLSHYLHQIETGALNLQQLPHDQKKKVIQNIIQGYFLNKSLNTDLLDQNSTADKHIQYLMIRTMPILKDMFKDKNFLQEVLGELSTLLKVSLNTSQIKGEFPFYHLGNHTLDFNKGLIFKGNKATGLLPKEVLENEMIRRLFFDKKTKQLSLPKDATLEFITDPKTGVDRTIYSFEQRPDLRLIHTPGKEPIVQMKMNSESNSTSAKWYELISFRDPRITGEEIGQNPFFAEISHLVLGQFVWREMDRPSHLVIKDETNKEHLYSVQLKEDKEGWQIKEVRRCKDQLILLNLKNIHEQWGSLTAIEDAAHIKIWGRSSTEVKEIEYPRIKMGDGSFLKYRTKKFKEKGESVTGLVSVHSNGFIMPYQAAPLRSKVLEGNLGMEILPHMYDNFQLLINPQTGAKKVLIPMQQAVRAGDSENSAGERYSNWLDHVKLDHQSRSWKNQTLLEFDFDQIKNTLKTESKQSNLFLAYLYFTSKRYEKAIEFLGASDTSQSMSLSHKNIYHWIQVWKDTTPEGEAFKLRAALALKGNQQKLGEKPPSHEQDLYELNRISELFKSYEKRKYQLSKSLQLSDKEFSFYKQMINQTYLPAIVTLPLKNAKVIIPETPWENNTEKVATDLLMLTKQLFVEMDGSELPKDEFALVSDKTFITGFKVLYESIFNADPHSEEYRKLKQIVEIAQLKSVSAQAIQTLLGNLIILKEQTKNIQDKAARNYLLAPYAFPSDFKQPYFKFMRLKIAKKNKAQPIKKLEELLIKLKNVKNGEKSNPAAKEEKDKFKDLPKKETKIDLKALDIAPTCNEGIYLAQTFLGSFMNQGIDIRKASSEKVFLELQKSGKLDKLIQERHVAELLDRKKKLDVYLSNQKAIPSQKKNQPVLANSKQGMQNDVITYPFSVDTFFDVQSAQITPDEKQIRVQKVTQFFNQYSKDIAVEPSAKGLAEKIQKDTEAFIVDQKIETIKFKPKANLKLLNQGVELKLKMMSKERQKVETQVLSLIKAKQNSVQQVLNKPLETVPQRLIGLYIDDRMQDVNSLMDLNLTAAEIQTLEKSVKEWMITAIQERMLSRALDLLKNISDPVQTSSETLLELYETLLPRRHFNIDDNSTESYSRELLAIEFVTGFILRSNQVETICAMLSDPSQVKQLGMGQGKSSVILPMLLRRIADGTRAAIGVLPEWLYEIVVGDLDKSSRSIFGQDIFKFEFDRNTKMDSEWLLNQYVTLAEAIKSRQVIVTTKTFMLSFRNKFLELQREHAKAHQKVLKNTKEKKLSLSSHSAIFADAIANPQGDKIKADAQNAINHYLDVNKGHLNDESHRKEINKKLALMANILHLFKTRGVAIADEIDTILDLRQELNYALGLPEKIENKKWATGLDVYKKILQVSKHYAAKIRQNEQSTFSEDDRQNIQKSVSEAFFIEWESKLVKEGVSKELFCDYVKGMKNLGVPLINQMPSFMNAFKIKDNDLFQSIGVLRQYLSQTLTTTLSHSGNVHYGRAPDGENTIPYKANKVPSEAEFGEDFERIAHFIQNYIQEGLSEKQVQVWINLLMSKISSEMYENLTQKGSMGIYQETPTYLFFNKEFPAFDIAKMSQDPALLKQFMNELNKNDDTKLNFLRNWIFPNLEMANLQVSSNALDLVNLFFSFGGFTGTPWNADTYHSNINIQAVQAKGTDGKTVELLSRMFEAGELSIRSFALDPENPLQSILNTDPNFMDRYDSIIDAGYYLKGVDQQSMIEQMGNIKSKKKAFVYITNENEKVIQTFGKEDTQPLQNRKDIKMEERLSYYDQGHTIGTDIPHAPTARAVLTIGENMYFKDLLQALWRMRKIDKGQKVDLLISEDVKKLIIKTRSPSHPDKLSNTITIQDIIIFCIKNQAEREAEDNLRAERQKLTGLVPNAMFWQLVEASRNRNSIPGKKNAAIKVRLLSFYHNFLFKRLMSDYEGLAKVASQEKTHQVLNDLKQSLIAAYEDVKQDLKLGNPQADQYFKNDLDKAIQELKNHSLLDPNKLPSETESVSNNAKNSQVQSQRQQQQQMSLQPKADLSPPNSGSWNQWNAKDMKELWDISQTLEKANQGVPFLDSDVRLTPNFAPKISSSQNGSLSTRMLNPKRIPVAQVLVIQNTQTGEWSFVLLDIKDYENVAAKLMKPTGQSFKAAIFDVRPQKGSLILRSTEDLNKNPWNEKEMQLIKEKLVKIKVFNKQINFYEKQEVESLKGWVKANPSVKPYFETHLLNQMTQSKQNSYSTSLLAKC